MRIITRLLCGWRFIQRNIMNSPLLLQQKARRYFDVPPLVVRQDSSMKPLCSGRPLMPPGRPFFATIRYSSFDKYARNHAILTSVRPRVTVRRPLHRRTGHDVPNDSVVGPTKHARTIAGRFSRERRAFCSESFLPQSGGSASRPGGSRDLHLSRLLAARTNRLINPKVNNASVPGSGTVPSFIHARLNRASVSVSYADFCLLHISRESHQ